MHCHDPIPMVAMADMTAGIQVKGATPHFLFWDPARMAWYAVPLLSLSLSLSLSVRVLCFFDKPERDGHTRRGAISHKGTKNGRSRLVSKCTSQP